MPGRERAILIVVLMLMIILAFLGLRVANQVREPRSISDKFVHSMLSEGVDDAYALTSNAFKQSNTKEDFAAMALRFDTDIRSNPRLAEQKIVRNKAGILVATMEYAIPGTEDHRLVVKLVRENGGWSVINIKHQPLICYHKAMYEEPVAKKRRFFNKRVAKSLVAGLASLGLLAGFFWLYSAERAATAPLWTSNAFLKDMFDKRIDEAYGLTSDIFQEETNKEQFTKVAESASKGLKKETLKPVEGQGAIEETDRGKLATITYEIEGNDGKYDMTVRLLKEQDKGWLIVGVENIKKS